MPTSSTPEPMKMRPNITKGECAGVMRLGILQWGGEGCIFDFIGGPTVIKDPWKRVKEI